MMKTKKNWRLQVLCEGHSYRKAQFWTPVLWMQAQPLGGKLDVVRILLGNVDRQS